MLKDLIFFITFLVPIALVAQEEAKNTEQFVSELDEKVEQLLQDLSVPGAAVAIIENGEIVLEKCYGYADKEKGIKVDKQTGFNIGSISKTIAAWGIMKLIHEGKMDLDDPAEKYLTRWHLPESEFDSNEVTIRRLLSHTAGLSLHGYPGWSPKDTLPTIEESLNGKNNGPGRVEIIMEPGTRYKYSGGGYTILQLIIEEVTGQKFEDYIQTEVLNPLGMTNSSYKIDDKMMTASSLEHNNFGEEIDFELFTAQAAAGLHTTLEDFKHLAFASLFGNKNREKYTAVLPNESIQHMMEAVPQADGFFGYGMGYQVDHVRPMVLSGHGGDNTGWHAIFRVNPMTNDGFLVLTNGGRGNTICYQVYCDWVNWKRGEPLGDWCTIKPPISNKLKRTIDSIGIDTIAAIYMDLKENQPDEYDFAESQLNDLGYHYLAKDEMEKAVTIFKLNTAAFPYAYNTYDSYGEALLKQGERAKAIENYKKSIKLNPDNENGIKVLEDLGISTENLMYKVAAEHLQLLEGTYIATDDEDWRISLKMNKGILKCDDAKYNYKFTLVPIDDHQFVNPDAGALWRFETSKPDEKPIMLFGKHQFKQIN